MKECRATIPEESPSTIETRFWLFAAGVVLISVLTRVFDFTLVPPMYNGVQVTQPFCGLHSVDQAARAWAARSHVKYGLGYTRGFRTLMVADPLAAQPQYDVSHPLLESRILALGVLIMIVLRRRGESRRAGGP